MDGGTAVQTIRTYPLLMDSTGFKDRYRDIRLKKADRVEDQIAKVGAVVLHLTNG